MGSRGAYVKGRIFSDEEIEAIIEAVQWESHKRMDREEARKAVKGRIMGKELTTEIFDEHCTGIIKFNSNGVNNVLAHKHSSTAEKKWAVERLVNKKLSLSYEGYENLRMDSHNIQKKLKWGYTGFNKYTFEYMGNTYRLKTAIVKNKYELPYNIDKL